MCLELHQNLTLFDYIRSSKGNIEEYRARDIAFKIGQALEYLHSNGVCLRSLDAQGILMSESDEQDEAIPRIYRLKDAIIMGFNDVTWKMYGDIRFRAPEVHQNKAYSFKADVWSFGIIIYLLLVGNLPYDMQNFTMS